MGTSLSFNFRIQNHNMLLVETEGSYTNQTILDSLDVHVGQSYSVLVTANQVDADYFIVASPKLPNATEFSSLVGVGVLHYSNSASPPIGPLPTGPDPLDLDFSVNQAKSIRQVKPLSSHISPGSIHFCKFILTSHNLDLILQIFLHRWNMTTGAARPNPQGTFNVTNVTLSQTFVLQNSVGMIKGLPQAFVNNVSYLTIDTPLKLADHLVNGSGVYQLDAFPVQSVNLNASFGVSVVTGDHKGWIEIVLKNNWEFIDSWHLDGFGFYVVGYVSKKVGNH